MESESRTVSGSSHQTIAIGVVLAVIVLIAIMQTSRDSAERPMFTPSDIEMVIDLNRATAEELRLLPGVGAKLASDIIELREQRGAFRSLEELMEVRGIKRTRFEQIRPYLVVTGDSLTTSP